jgi:hypothetical protein
MLWRKRLHTYVFIYYVTKVYKLKVAFNDTVTNYFEITSFLIFSNSIFLFPILLPGFGNVILN